MRKIKRLGVMMAAAFALMPLPTMIEAQASDAIPQVLEEAISTVFTAVNRAGVIVNGVPKGAVDPIQIGDVYYVPFKQIARMLGYEHISYNSSTKTYRATDGSSTVSVTIGSTRGMKGDEELNIPAPQWIKGTAYVSMDTVSSMFNTFAYYRATDGSVQIQMPARQYRVQGGDTLWKIAAAHHTSIGAIRSANNIYSDNLSVGQVLRLPSESDTREMEPADDRNGSTTPSPHSESARAAENTPQTAPAPASGVAAQNKADAIIATGKKYIGVPYKFGAKPEEAPRCFDCSSFVQYCFRQHGVSLPRDSRQQSSEGVRVSDLKPGDLLFFKYPERYSDGRVGHVGIYIGNGQMLHAIPRTGVTITNYQKSGYWTRNFLFAKRVLQ
jgi:peptidoglycan endopeptidase LytE